MYIIGRKTRGTMNYISIHGGRTKLMNKAKLWETDQCGFDLALESRELPGDHLIRVWHDSDQIRKVWPDSEVQEWLADQSKKKTQ